MCGRCDDPAYIIYLDDLDRQQRLADERRGKPAPNPWGARMSDTGYFCHSCWLSGLDTGEHPYDDPPCDPIRRMDVG